MNRFIEHPTNKTYDIIIIGGGISGAAVSISDFQESLATTP